MTIQATGFGWIETDKARFDYDIVIYAEGRVECRFPTRFGDSHTISRKEVQRVLAQSKARLVIGSGQQGVAKLAKEAMDFLKENCIEFKIAPTPEAIGYYNQMPEPKAAIFHVTC